MNATITPVAIFPSSANQLQVDDSWASSIGGVPRFNYRLNNYTPGVAAILASDGVTVQTPAVDPVTVVLKEGIVYMTADQWNNWAAGTGNDQGYILACVAANLGVTLTQ